MKTKTKKQKSRVSPATHLAFCNCLIVLILLTILYFVLPIILNYPKNTINNDFQLQITGITYSNQYIIFSLLIIAFVFIFVRSVYNSLYKSSFGDSDTVAKARIKYFNTPYIMIIAQALLPTLLSCILLIIFKTNFELILRICTVVFSIASIFAITSYMISKPFLKNLLIKTSDYNDYDKNSFKLGEISKLLILILPLFLCSFVLLLLVATTTMTLEKGNLLHEYYKQELINSFDKEVFTKEEVLNIVTSFKYKSDSDFAVILSSNGEILYTEGKLLDEKFLSLYTTSFYTEQNGQCFEYYGQDTQVAMHKVHTNEGDFYVGIHFEVFGVNILIPFMICILALLIFIIVFIIYVGKDISNDIISIKDGLNNILNSKNILKAKSLPITSNDEFGDLTISYNKVQDLTKSHLEQIERNQEILMGRERLASLGQLIGGIAHNLKTPIMSISGAREGLSDLVKEYQISINDPEVTAEDHLDIAKDMNEWLDKISNYTEYMSDIITTVKGQAVALSNDDNLDFTVEELIKGVDILMKHELKNSLTSLQVSVNVSPTTLIHGNINSLIQILNNMISNSIQAYNGIPNQNINLIFSMENNNLKISVQDFASGLSEEVKQKLFNEMITTKGKNGTGLGLFMSYSTIKANFNGNITFDSKEGNGTTFNIYIPL